MIAVEKKKGAVGLIYYSVMRLRYSRRYELRDHPLFVGIAGYSLTRFPYSDKISIRGKW